MALLVRDVERHLRHSLRGIGEFSAVEVSNAAGSALCNAHPWAWLITASTGLDLVAGQDYIALPASREIMAVQEAGPNGGWVQLAGPREMLCAKEGWLSGGGIYRIMPAYRRDADGVPFRVLELAPTPTEAKVGAFRIWYRGDWVPVTEDGSKVAVPQWLEAIFLEFARAFAHGWQFPEQGRPQDLLGSIRASHDWADALATDGELAGPVGAMRPFPGREDYYGDYEYVLPPRTING